RLPKNSVMSNRCSPALGPSGGVTTMRLSPGVIGAVIWSQLASPRCVQTAEYRSGVVCQGTGTLARLLSALIAALPALDGRYGSATPSPGTSAAGLTHMTCMPSVGLGVGTSRLTPLAGNAEVRRGRRGGVEAGVGDHAVQLGGGGAGRQVLEGAADPLARRDHDVPARDDGRHQALAGLRATRRRRPRCPRRAAA